jgi:hypothetical protein
LRRLTSSECQQARQELFFFLVRGNTPVEVRAIAFSLSDAVANRC